MRLCIFTEPQQGAAYDDLLRIARHTEDCSFDGFFRSDHYLTMGGTGLPGPTDAWLTLAALAVQTSRVRLGTLVTSATFRLPGPLAISVAQVDAMSGGRVELGLGTGWFDAEHQAYGIPFPSPRERFDRLTEQLEVITGLWSTPVGGTFDHHGTYYQLTESPALPKPVQSPMPPVIVGGKGLRRTPMLAARFADEFNVPFSSADEVARSYAAVAGACERAGRAAAGRAPLVLSAALTVLCGRSDAEVRRRAEAVGRDPAELRAVSGVAGTPDQVVEQLQEYAKHGAERFFLQVLDLADLDHLDLIASEVARQL
ncbi:LLM class F420-dependent oxidoreductase [Plantactinospora sp. S1510]|uniref:LLM class F420-dependent oxidoreductase n=1 Tax=Plantactinospora alkalitolerans TaxID=2789879 RepID=A0ABS0GRV0_9ACTN|nr:LLM class F420-dependent oxidoreductase [Plantactinospora alkalitolerans]MBF9128931.1 LLM class F420-dependent oxidoreductase [Plantactinospora alkalitolerans]